MSSILFVSNRLPVTIQMEGKEPRIMPSAGGLATGLRSPHEGSGGLWIGWPGDLRKLSPDERTAVEEELASRRLRPVSLTPSQVDRFYHGYCNGVIWPLFHYLIDKLPLESHEWDFYRQVNEVFAEAVCASYRDGDQIWIHDYHLMLLPEILRKKLPDARIGFFLHIPFPSSEILRILPRRAEILRGLLGADLIGFHSPSYMRHFSFSVLRILGIEANVDRIAYEGREIRLGIYPMGIDAKTFDSYANDPEITREAKAIRRESNGARILLGVDRLDYTKGLPRKLLAFERLLEKRPDLRGGVRLIQVATPSRLEVGEYRAYKSQLDGLVGSINGKFGTTRNVPVHYINKSLPQKAISSLYMAADVMVVTPLRDGLNLVAKEYVACKRDLDGVLVLSEFAGVASELAEGIIVNPYDLEEVASALARALSMDRTEISARMRSMRERVFKYDVHRWASAFLDDLAALPAERTRPPTTSSGPDAIGGCIDRIRTAHPAVFFLDYDGTLMPLFAHPDEATPDGALLNLLEELSSHPDFQVHILSGRVREFLDRWLGNLPVFLHAEHGLWSKIARTNEWVRHSSICDDWKEKIRPLFRQFTNSTPGSLIEEKTAGLVWHYRRSDPFLGAAQAKELRLLLFELLSNIPVQVTAGDKVVEVRPQGIDKGTVARRVLASSPPQALAVAMGDDRTDEDLFGALPPDSIAVHIGPLPSRAPYRLASVEKARSFLRAVLETVRTR